MSMPEVSVQSGHEVRTTNQALNLVLFGMPSAGKTSLLGALAQASNTQAQLLNGRLMDRNGSLSLLWNLLQEEPNQPTPEEIVPYAIHFEPGPEGGRKRQNGGFDAVLIDC